MAIKLKMTKGILYRSALAAMIGITASWASWVQAKTDVEVLVSGTVHQALYAIDFIGNDGIAVGADGEIQTTEDGGKTWKQDKLPTSLALLGIDMHPERTLLVGQTGTGFRQANGGEWQELDMATTSRLFGVSSNDGGLAFAVGEFGTMVVSLDGGKTWSSITLDWFEVGTDGGAEPHLYDVQVDNDGVVSVVGEFGLILRSNDQGKTWKVVSKATASLFSIEIREDGRGFAVGQDGYALKTRDGGRTWDCVSLGSKAILNGVHSMPDGRVVVTAMREMMISRDGGESWKALEADEVTLIWYVGVASSDEAVMAVGQGGRILRIGV